MQTLDNELQQNLDDPLMETDLSAAAEPPAAESPSWVTQAGLLAIMALGILLWMPHLRDWWLISRTTAIFSHAPLLFGLAAVHFWLVRDRLRGWSSANPWGLALLIGSSLLFLAAGLLDVPFLKFLSLLGMTAGAIGYLGGVRTLKASLGPLGFLALALPLPSFIAERLTLPLQHSISAYTALAVGTMGFPVYRDGIRLSIMPDPSAPPAFTILVAQTCNGLGSLLVLLALGYLAAYHTPVRGWAKALMVAAMLPLALLVNVLRAGSILLAGAYHSPELAQWFHVNASPLLLFVSSLSILGLRKLLMAWDAARLERNSPSGSASSVRREGGEDREDAEGIEGAQEEAREGEPAGV